MWDWMWEMGEITRVRRVQQTYPRDDMRSEDVKGERFMGDSGIMGQRKARGVRPE